MEGPVAEGVVPYPGAYAVHRFEGTVNQVLGDGIMALFGAPIAHEDHALRACYAALAAAIALCRAMDMTFWLPQAEAALAQVEGR